MSGIIYKVTSPTGKVYVGQTINGLDLRKQNHISRALNSKSKVYNTKLSNAIRKYENELKWEIIYEDVLEEKLNELETQTIKECNSYCDGYNMTLGAYDVSFRGRKHTEESKKLMSISSLGLPTWNKGLKTGSLSCFHKKTISEALKNRTLSREHIQNITGLNHHNFNYNIDIDSIYNAIKKVGTKQREVAEFLNVGRKLIARRVNAFGFTWDAFCKYKGVK